MLCKLKTSLLQSISFDPWWSQRNWRWQRTRCSTQFLSRANPTPAVPTLPHHSCWERFKKLVQTGKQPSIRYESILSISLCFQNLLVLELSAIFLWSFSRQIFLLSPSPCAEESWSRIRREMTEESITTVGLTINSQHKKGTIMLLQAPSILLSVPRHPLLAWETITQWAHHPFKNPHSQLLTQITAPAVTWTSEAASLGLVPYTQVIQDILGKVKLRFQRLMAWTWILP